MKMKFEIEVEVPPERSKEVVMDLIQDALEEAGFDDVNILSGKEYPNG